MCPGKAHSLHGTPSRVSAWKEARGGPLHLPTQTLLTSMVAETPPVLQSPKLLGPRPLGQQSAACPCASPTMASSGSSSTSSGTFALGPCGRITSQGICGWPGQGLSANVLTPLPPENGGDPSARPGVPRRQVCPNSEGVASFVHLAPLAHTWLLRSLFWEDSVVSGGVLREEGAGFGGWWERVLCWDEALYPHIFLWEWESGISVALLPSVASSAQGPSGFCLLSGVTGFGLRFGGLGLCLGLGLGLALGVAVALALVLGLALPCL